MAETLPRGAARPAPGGARPAARPAARSSGHGERRSLDFDENFADSGQVTAERGEVEALAGQLERDPRTRSRTRWRKFDAGTYGECESCQRRDRRGAARGDAGGAPLHRPARRSAAEPPFAADRISSRRSSSSAASSSRSSSTRSATASSRCWFGDDTAKRAGRLTLNPVPHIDPFGSIILPGDGRARRAPGARVGQAGAGEPDALRNPRRDMLFVSLAGPATNFVLMAIASAFARARLFDPRVGAAGVRVLRPAARRPDPVLVRAGRTCSSACSTCCRSRRSTARRCIERVLPGRLAAARGTGSGPTGSSCCSCSCSRPACRRAYPRPVLRRARSTSCSSTMKVAAPRSALLRRAVARAPPAADDVAWVGGGAQRRRRSTLWRAHAEPRPAPLARGRARRARRSSPAPSTPAIRAGSRPRCSTTSASSTRASACTAAWWRRCRARSAGRDMAEAWSETRGLHPPGRPLPASPRARRRPHPPRRRPRGGRRWAAAHHDPRRLGAPPASPTSVVVALVAADDD